MRRPLRLLVACALSVAGRAQLVSRADSSAEAQRVRDVQRSVPRLDLAGELVAARWCLPDERGACRWNDYAVSLVAASISTITLVVLFTTLACCCCCNPHELCCTWRARPGLPCCAGEESAFAGYRQSQVTTSRLALFVALVLLGFFSLSGWEGRPHVDDGMRQLANALRDSSARVDSSARKLVRETEVAIASQRLRSPVANAPAAFDAGARLGEAARLSRGLARAGDALERLNAARAAMLDASLVLPLVATSGGLIAALLNLGPVVGLWGIVTSAATALVWLVLLIHFPLIPLLSDLCDYVDGVVEAGTLSATDSFTGCTNGSTFARLDQTLALAMQHSSTIACAGFGAITLAGDADLSGLSCALSGLNLAAIEAVEFGRCGGRTNASLLECAGACPPSNLTGTCNPLEPPGRAQMATARCPASCRAAVVSDAVADYARYRALREQQLRPLLECQFVADLYARMREGACVDLVVGLNLVCTAAEAMGVTAVLALLVMVPGCKLFNKQNHAAYRRYGLGVQDYIRARRDEVCAQSAAERAQLVVASGGGWMGRKAGVASSRALGAAPAAEAC